jgi:hypothetical protein
MPLLTAEHVCIAYADAVYQRLHITPPTRRSDATSASACVAPPPSDKPMLHSGRWGTLRPTLQVNS